MVLQQVKQFKIQRIYEDKIILIFPLWKAIDKAVQFTWPKLFAELDMERRQKLQRQ